MNSSETKPGPDDTPRTDGKFSSQPIYYLSKAGNHFPVIEINFARTLERELTETVRLLEAAAKYVPYNAIKGDWREKPIDEVRLLTQIHTHLKKLKGTK